MKFIRLFSSSEILIGSTSTLIPVSSNIPCVIEGKFELPLAPGGRYGGTFFSRISAAASSKIAAVFGKPPLCSCRNNVCSGQPKLYQNHD